MTLGKRAASSSNYTCSVRAVVNKGEQSIGITLMGKTLMNILCAPNASSSKYFNNLSNLQQCKGKSN